MGWLLEMRMFKHDTPLTHLNPGGFLGDALGGDLAEEVGAAQG